MTLIRELIDIPTQVRDGDFVLKLTESVGTDAAEATVRSYEVTPQLARAFDQALGKIAGALSSGSSEALYLHGSFGAGKSHFMAVLHLLLQGHPAARAKPELHPAMARHEADLAGKRFLLVPVHFLDARSMEQKILGGYVERVAAEAPGVPLPAVFLGDAIVAPSCQVSGAGWATRPSSPGSTARGRATTTGATSRPPGPWPRWRRRWPHRPRASSAAPWWLRTSPPTGRGRRARPWPPARATSTSAGAWPPSAPTPRASATTPSSSSSTS